VIRGGAFVFTTFWFLSALTWASDIGLVSRDTELFSRPAPTAEPLAHLHAGDRVTLTDRQGPYYRTQAAGQAGWLPLFDLRLSSLESVKPKSPSRYIIRTRSAVMGVRGLDEVDLKAAKPDPSALE
jgi:hypothetical protein